MECTGKLEMNECSLNAIDIASVKRGLYIVVAQIINDNDELTETDRANAKKLVRRWNAFEKDGLVEELKSTLEELVNIIDGINEGVDYKIDSLTAQPARIILAKIQVRT